MTVRITWPDGHQDEAATFAALLRQMRRESWLHSYGPIGYRRSLVERLEKWNGRRVPISGSARTFLTRLADAGAFDLMGDER